jgi:hypothetical protein
MTTPTFLLPRRGSVGLYVLLGGPLLAVLSAGLLAQPPAVPPPALSPPVAPSADLQRPPLVPVDTLAGAGASTSSAVSTPNRIRLFRIQPGFLSDPVGLDSDDKTGAEPLPPDPDTGPDWINIAVGNDNPYFDFRRNSDPGGVGYTRVNTQIQLFDTTRTACSVGFQAVTPTGLELAGLADKMGTTVVTPALSLFHTLEDETSVQAFVGRHMPVMNTAVQSNLNRDLQYGVALQRPLATESNDPLRFVYLSVGALGQVRLGDSSNSSKPVVWEVLPGVHYKVADNWWISGAVALPVNAQTSNVNGQQWQVFCYLQF